MSSEIATAPDKVAKGRIKRHRPQLKMIMVCVDLLASIAQRKGATPGQIALAWPLAQSLGSSRSPARASCTGWKRTSAPLTSISRPTNSPRSRTPPPKIQIQGGHYNEAQERMTNL